MDHFELVSPYEPTGDQPQAIEELVQGFKEGNQFQTLLGVTGSGKTFTMANVIAQRQRSERQNIGLTHEEAARLLEAEGENRFAAKKKITEIL